MQEPLTPLLTQTSPRNSLGVGSLDGEGTRAGPGKSTARCGHSGRRPDAATALSAASDVDRLKPPVVVANLLRCPPCATVGRTSVRPMSALTICSRLLLGCLLLTLTAGSAIAAEAKRVLMVHSFGSTAPPFTTHSTAFETTLTKELGSRVDLDEVSLDMARYAEPDMEVPFVELLRRRLEKWKPDLVVPIGSPAGRFVNKYRDRLFPRTPVIYTGMDRRALPPGAFKNATFVGEDF